MTQPNAATWWLTGLPSAGKSTLAQALAAALRERGEAACVIDGAVADGAELDLVAVWKGVRYISPRYISPMVPF